MNNPVQLSIAIHNHQPVGNFDHVFDMACERAYLPFLRLLAEFPRLQIGLHTSGCLWEWVESNKPEYGQLVDKLLQTGQVELLGGGMYEPILPVLPARDAIWQLKRLNRFLENRFDVKPTGMWCPERVWEPNMPEIVSSGDLHYTLLDDHHFRGSAEQKLIQAEYFLTEYSGHSVALFPISQMLRYTMPFQPVESTFDYLQTIANTSNSGPAPLVVFGDDGEKFGIWPDTYEWVYEKGWLRRFFTRLTESLDWIEMLKPSDVLKRRQPAGTVYLPSASYAEMGEWSRVDPDGDDDAPAGVWRNYFRKYPEARDMYNRVQYISNQVHSNMQEVEPGVRDSILDNIGRAQCNCAYWHGIFGGIYLNYLRNAISHHALKAEREYLASLPPMERKVSEYVPDENGTQQFIAHSYEIVAVISPGKGLCIPRLDYLPTLFCWTDVLARRREAYHKKLVDAGTNTSDEHASIHDRVVVKEAGLVDRLAVDDHQRACFTTYITGEGEFEAFARSRQDSDEHSQSLESQFSDYGCNAIDLKVGDTTISAALDLGCMLLNKSISFVKEKIICSVQASQPENIAADRVFVVEFNLTALTDQSDDRYLVIDDQRLPLSKSHAKDSIKEISLVDEWQNARFTLSTANECDVIYYPVRTVSSSEGGFELTYQGGCLMLAFDVNVLMSKIDIEISIEEL